MTWGLILDCVFRFFFVTRYLRNVLTNGMSDRKTPPTPLALEPKLPALEPKLTAKHIPVIHDPLAVTDMMLHHLTHGNCPNYRLVEYIWIDADGGLRSKTRVLKQLEMPSIWNFDGSSTGQAAGHDSEIELVPVKYVHDPFMGNDHLLALCECQKAGAPAVNNYRHAAHQVFTEHQAVKPWYGIEQEYTVMKPDNERPIGWPDEGHPVRQGPYYCGVGAEKCFGRKLVEVHLLLCLDAGLTMSGKNGEVMPGQWEFQVGPCEGINSGDELWLARYILIRVAEMMGLIVSFHPKPLSGDWNGSGLHTNYSTEKTRKFGGLTEIHRIVRNMSRLHAEHIDEYGDNSQRLTGLHETSDLSTFSAGVADRGASIRIPSHVEREGLGYFEDRRPASSADPYRVTLRLLQTTLIED